MLIVGSPSLLEAQNDLRLSGTITDTDDNPLPGVVVTVPAIEIGTVTNSEGQFILMVPPGTHEVQVHALGFESVSRSVTVSGGATHQINFVLDAALLELEEVVALGPAGPGPRSAWAGARVGYNLGGGEGTDNFQASGNARLQILGPDRHRFGTYVFGNFSRLITGTQTKDPSESEEVKLRELQQSANGIYLSIVPHLFWGDATAESLTIWGSVGWKLNSLAAAQSETTGSEGAEVHFVNQGRFSLGTSMTALQGATAELPLSLSVEPYVAFFSSAAYESVFGESRSSLAGLDLMLIVPVARGAGVAFEYGAARGSKPSLLVGLLLNTADNVASRVGNP